MKKRFGRKDAPQPVIREVHDRIIPTSLRKGIPRRVFQTAESNRVNEQLFGSITAFRDVNPDLSFEFFDANKRLAFMSEYWSSHPVFDIYTRAEFGQMKADIFRYCVVWSFGGYYFDFNKGCRVPLSSLHPRNARGMISYEKNPNLIFPPLDSASRVSDPFHLVLQWGFGFEKEHPFLMHVIDQMVTVEPFFRGKLFHEPKKALLAMSATGLFTRAYHSWTATHPESDIFEAGTDFFGQGIFRLDGSVSDAQRDSHYSRQRDREIVRHE